MKNGMPKSLIFKPKSIRNLLSTNFWQKMILDINKSKGKSHEKEFAQIYIDSLSKKMNTSNLSIEIDKVWFNCFEVRWILYNGATANVLNSLTKNKILYLDIAGNEHDFTNINKIYHEKNGIVLTDEGVTVIPL